MADDLRNWLNNIIESSQRQWKYMSIMSESAPDGWKDIFASFLEDGPFSSGNGILLAGSDDYSKQSAAAQMVRLLLSNGYECVFLDGDSLGADNAAQAIQRIEGLLDHFYDIGRGVCLSLQGIQECPCRRELLSYLGQTLWAYYEDAGVNPQLFLILIDDREQDLPLLLRGRLRLCRVNLPNQHRRRAYLSQHANFLRNYLSLDLLAQITEGFSYIQLQDVIIIIQHMIKSRDGEALSDEVLRNFVAEQMPPMPQEDSLQALCRSVQQLAEQFPLLLNGSAAIRSAAPVEYGTLPAKQQAQPKEAAPMDEAEFLKNKQAEIEEMPPWDLAVDLLGEEGHQELLAQIRQQ